MDKFIICGLLSGSSAIVITPIADYGFGQHWNFFVVWLVVFCLFFFGEWVVD